MATTSAVENGSDRRIDHDRLERTLTEDLDVADHAPAMYELSNGEGTTRIVDVETGTCECADYQYRGDEVVCKHVLRACIHHLFRSQSNTLLVARVARAIAEHGCPHDESGCAGPTTVGARGYPCPSCVDATSSGDWTVWQALVGDGR